MMVDAFYNINSQLHWLFNGGSIAIKSFDVESVEEIPRSYFDFIEAMPYFFEVDNYILVHAGLSFELPNPYDDYKSMLWIRNWYGVINLNWLGNRIIVHGHTPIAKSEVVSMCDQLEKKQFLNIDTGCVYKGRLKGLGFLSCFNLDPKALIFQENIDF